MSECSSPPETMEGAEAADPEEPVGRTGKTESDAAHCDALLGA